MPIALFDIDGTLTASNEIDSVCRAEAFRQVFGCELDTNWGSYEHTTDRGIAIEALWQALVRPRCSKTFLIRPQCSQQSIALSKRA